MILTCSQTPSFAGIIGALSSTLIPPSNLLPACLGAWTSTFSALGQLLYTLVHCLLQGFLWPCCFTKKVTCWRPESHGNTSLFIWPDNSCYMLLRLTWVFARTPQTYSFMNVFCAHIICFAHCESHTSVDFACYSALYFVQLPLRYDTCKSITTVCNTIFTLCPPEQTLQTHWNTFPKPCSGKYPALETTGEVTDCRMFDI